MKPKFKRILLKLSGEILKGKKEDIGFAEIDSIAEQIKEVHEIGVEIGIVVGGGNIYRGVNYSKSGIDRVTGDYIGMLATVINSLALQNFLEKKGLYTRALTAIEMREIAEPFIRRRALRHLEKGRIVIFAAGTGSPYFTTDTAAALKAVEIEAEVILKATKVDGVYDKDPMKFSKAKKIQFIPFMQVIKKELKVLDTTAISMCMENNIPIVVFNILKKGNLKKIVLGEEIGSFIGGDKS